MDGLAWISIQFAMILNSKSQQMLKFDKQETINEI